MKNITNHNIKHIGFILDGNGRWAKKRGLIRSMGHRVGFDNVKTILNEVYALGIKHMSVYTFSAATRPS